MKQIKLTQGKVALVDDDLYEFLNQWKWCAVKVGKTFYATRKQAKQHIAMHRVIAKIRGIPVDGKIDHDDGDGLNNQTFNLRPATVQQNSANRGPNRNSTSGLKGVFWHKQKCRWYGQIRINGTIKHLGYFDTALEAAIAYDDVAKAAFGEFAYSNERILANLA